MSSTSSMSGAEQARTAEEGTSRSDQAREQGQQVAQRAKGEAQATKETAKQEAGHVADEAKRQARGLIGNLGSQLQDQAEEQTQRISGLLLDLQGNLEALQEGRADDAGPLGEYLQRATDEVERLASRVDELGFSGLVQELQRFARRRPGVFLGTAAAAGFLAGRLGRGARDAQKPGAGLGSRDTRALPESTDRDRDEEIDLSERPVGRSAGTVPTATGGSTVGAPSVGNAGTPAAGIEAQPPADTGTGTAGATDPLRRFEESDR